MTNIVKAKRRKGLKFYAYGFQITIPSSDGSDPKQITFTGSFDRRKLRKMINKMLVKKMTVVQLDWMIDNLGTPLRPMTRDEIHRMADFLEDDDAEAQDDATESNAG